MKKLVSLIIVSLFITFNLSAQGDINRVFNSYGVYGLLDTWENADSISKLGFKYVILYTGGQYTGNWPDIILTNTQSCKNANLDVIVDVESVEQVKIICEHLKNEPNIIGWLVSDEVDDKKIPISTQNDLINEIKVHSSLPIFGSSNYRDARFSNGISDKYDYIFRFFIKVSG